jgi:hypothetical protein
LQVKKKIAGLESKTQLSIIIIQKNTTDIPAPLTNAVGTVPMPFGGASTVQKS